MFLSCWRQQHHCRREFDSFLPACCESTRTPWDTAQYFAPCHKPAWLHEHSDPAEVFSCSQAHSSPVNPPACLYLAFASLLSHGQSTREVGAGQGSGSCSLYRSEAKEAGSGTCRERGQTGAKHHCQHRGSKSNRLYPGGRHIHADRGYCRIQKSAQKIYKRSERGQNREHQSLHLPVSSRCCFRAFTGLANPIIPV